MIKETKNSITQQLASIYNLDIIEILEITDKSIFVKFKMFEV